MNILTRLTIWCYIRQTKNNIRTYSNNKYFWVETAEYTNDIEVRRLIIHHGYQRQGIGTVIIKRLKRLATTRQKSLIVRYVLDGAVPFYIENGFVGDGNRMTFTPARIR